VFYVPANTVDGFYRSKDPTNSTEGNAANENNPENEENTKYTHAHTQNTRPIQHTTITQQVP